MQDLRFGLELELAQLFLQARDGARQLADVEVDGADLLFEARARDARFAGIVEQLVEQLGVDARELGPIGRRGGFAARRHGARRQQRPVGRAFVLVRISVEARGDRIFRRGAHHDGRRLGDGADTAASTGGSGTRSARGGGGTYAGFGARHGGDRRAAAGFGTGGGAARPVGAGGGAGSAPARASGAARGARLRAPARQARVRRHRRGSRRGGGAARLPARGAAAAGDPLTSA